MRGSFRKLRFGPLPNAGGGTPIGSATGVRGVRVPIGPRGTYVGFGPGGFWYRSKVDDAFPALSTTSSPMDAIASLPPSTVEAALQDIQQRSKRVNVFKLYVVVAGVLLLLSIGSRVVLLLGLAFVWIGVYVRRWDRNRRTAQILYDVDNEEIARRLALCAAVGDALASAANVWHVIASATARERKQYAAASMFVERTPAKCSPGALPGIDLNVEARFVIAGPNQLLLLPDQLVIRAGAQISAVPYAWLTVEADTTLCVATNGVPRDAPVVDRTWRFTKKSGGPDLRYKNNPAIPVLQYGELTLRAPTGFNVILQTSNPAATHHAALAMQELVRAATPQAPQPNRRSNIAEPVAHNPVPLTPYQHVPPPGPHAPRPPSAAASPSQSAVSNPPAVRGDPPSPKASFPASPVAVPSNAASVIAQLVHDPLRSHSRSEQRPSNAQPPRFHGINAPISIAGRTIERPLAYVAPALGRAVEAGTIVTSLSVGEAWKALPLPYWPSYAEASSDQRARFLDWMAGGRNDPEIELGYFFIFFYGVEWRSLREGVDEDSIADEVIRLARMHSLRSASLRSYTSNFLAFLALKRLDALDEDALCSKVGWLIAESEAATNAVYAWYVARGRALPARLAVLVAASLDGAKRGVVVTQARKELEDLFAVRYREKFGDGLKLAAAARPLPIEYHPASGTWLRSGYKLSLNVPDVASRPSQFTPLLTIWNQCIDDLRKVSSLKRKAEGELTVEAWSALPPALRAQYEHPKRERWDAAVTAAPRIAIFHRMRCGDLATLAGMPSTPKVTTAQLCKIVDMAADLGYAVEPDARAQRKGANWKDEMLVWSSPNTAPPDARLYGPAYALLALAMVVVSADGEALDEEIHIVMSMLGSLFALDDALRTRLTALRHLLARHPARANKLAKKLRETRSRDELTKVGRLLVAIAAADGVIVDTEHDALRDLYKGLGLPISALAAAIATSGARLASDEVVPVRPPEPGKPGERIPAPPPVSPSVALDHAAIAAIMADTRDVAAMLAEVLDQEDDEPAPPRKEPAAPEAPADASLVSNLDHRYHTVLQDLLAKSQWSMDEIGALAARRKLMPGAILETLNAWADETYGDFLIEEGDHWSIRTELIRRTST
jgi:hypothetical protein